MKSKGYTEIKKWKWKSLSYLREVSLTDAFRQVIDGYLGTIELLRQEIERVSLTIASQAQQDPRALRLTELYGTGYYLALLIVAEIGDIKMDGDCLLIRRIPGFP